MPYVDFAALKAKHCITDVLAAYGMLNSLKREGAVLRGTCPLCEGSRAFVVSVEKQSWYCHSCEFGGDFIKLIAKVQKVSDKDAALDIQRVMSDKPVLEALDHIDPENEAVEAIGFPLPVAHRLGIGYAKKGVLRGKVAVPIRDERGKLIGYIGVPKDTDLIIPKSIKECA